VHIYLLGSVRIPETEYQAFMEYTQMRHKHKYMQQFNINSKDNIARTISVYGAFTERSQLFESFEMVLNFEKFDLMRGMREIIAWSLRDETLNVKSIIKLFHSFIAESSEV
jgi:ribonucleoside-diphosphate reductase beta chain